MGVSFSKYSVCWELADLWAETNCNARTCEMWMPDMEVEKLNGQGDLQSQSAGAKSGLEEGMWTLSMYKQSSHGTERPYPREELGLERKRKEGPGQSCGTYYGLPESTGPERQSGRTTQSAGGRHVSWRWIKPWGASVSRMFLLRGHIRWGQRQCREEGAPWWP